MLVLNTSVETAADQKTRCYNDGLNSMKWFDEKKEGKTASDRAPCIVMLVKVLTLID